MPPLLADFTHARPCKPFCEKYLTLPVQSGRRNLLFKTDRFSRFLHENAGKKTRRRSPVFAKF